MSFQSVRNARVESSQISSSGWAISLQSSFDNVIANNRLEEVYNGIRILGGSGNIVQANSIDRHLGYGIRVASPGNFVRNNDVSRGGFCWKPLACFIGWGISVEFSTGNTVAGNIVSDENSRGDCLGRGLLQHCFQ